MRIEFPIRCPDLEFQRRSFRTRPWWGEIVGENRALADAIVDRVSESGPCRSTDLTGLQDNQALTKHVASALWMAGMLAIRERQAFTKIYDLPERVIPAELRENPFAEEEALRHLVLRSIEGHGFTPLKTLIQTFDIRRQLSGGLVALTALADSGDLVEAEFDHGEGTVTGWIRPADLELAARLRRVRPRPDRGVLLSPFDPVLWDRDRVRILFGFDQVLEIYKPKAKRV